PEADWTHVIRMKPAAFSPAAAAVLDLHSGKWIKHPLVAPSGPPTLADRQQSAASARASWCDAFQYKREDINNKVLGLRPPQLGAIHAVQGHWTAEAIPATVVLPTGVGKTETMLSLLIVEQLERLLVVV